MLEEIHCNWEDSYSLLPFYLVQLLRIGPAMLTLSIREPDGSFLRFFWAFGPYVCSYNVHLRRVLCAEKYFKTLLVS